MENAIVIDPEALNVPWFSSFRMTLQSKHWKAAEEACRELIENIAQSKAKDKGILPQNLETFASPAARAKIDEVVDTSVSIVVNVWPRASEKRICLLAQGCVFLFLHDGLFTSKPLYCLLTVIKMSLSAKRIQKWYVFLLFHGILLLIVIF